MRDSSSPIVRFEALTKSFREGDKTREVLKQITLDIEAEKFTAILGPSGSGKSTLLNIASGIEAPDQGDVIVDGIPLTRLSDRERTLFRRDKIGIVFQFFNLIPTLTVLENITLPQELAGRRPADVRQNALNLLEQVGLGDRLNTFPDKLSGGEQQRVAIARALAHDPLIILADEPTGNLDTKTGEKVMDLLLSLTRQAGKTLIMATHSPAIVPLADRVLRVVNGQVVEADEVDHEDLSAEWEPLSA